MLRPATSQEERQPAGAAAEYHGHTRPDVQEDVPRGQTGCRLVGGQPQLIVTRQRGFLRIVGGRERLGPVYFALSCAACCLRPLSPCGSRTVKQYLALTEVDVVAYVDDPTHAERLIS